jgi:hypothetical protein
MAGVRSAVLLSEGFAARGAMNDPIALGFCGCEGLGVDGLPESEGSFPATGSLGIC